MKRDGFFSALAAFTVTIGLAFGASAMDTDIRNAQDGCQDEATYARYTAERCQQLSDEYDLEWQAFLACDSEEELTGEDLGCSQPVYPDALYDVCDMAETAENRLLVCLVMQGSYDP